VRKSRREGFGVETCVSMVKQGTAVQERGRGKGEKRLQASLINQKKEYKEEEIGISNQGSWKRNESGGKENLEALTIEHELDCKSELKVGGEEKGADEVKVGAISRDWLSLKRKAQNKRHFNPV